MTLPAGITIDLASREAWEAIVVGAGPAGALAARELVRLGRRTLLVDGKRFPRPKVCGGCLNQRALAALDRAGLGGVLEDCGAVPIDRLEVVNGRQTLRLSLPPGLAVSRATLDARLVAAAIDAGASFLPETTAVVERELIDGRRALLATHAGRKVQLSARVVVCADGLLRSSLKQLPEFAARVATDSRVGIGALLERDATERYPAGDIVMVVARGGYVGLTRVDGNQLNVAAAIDPDLLHAERSAAAAVESILRTAELPTPRGLVAAAWHGTPPLTSSAGRAAGERIFVVGDACGYVEPFTGEGIAWALEGALDVAPLADRACQAWQLSLGQQWEAACRRFQRRSQAACRTLAWILHRPWSAGAAMAVCRAFPWAARSVVSRINRPSRGPLVVDMK
jgi:flavin-dependent dehydrogenase